MYLWGKYWGECIEWAYWRWGVGERMLTIIYYILTISGISIGSVIAGKSGEYWFIVAGFLPIIILTIFIAPYKISKQKEDKLIELTTKKLYAELEEYPEITDEHTWWHLIVRNPSSIPIKGCYGKIISFNPNPQNKPYTSFYLPWTSYSGATTPGITIPGKGNNVLDFVMSNTGGLWPFCFFMKDSWIRGTPYKENVGEYNIEIQIGSLEEILEPLIIKLVVVLDNKGNLNVKEKERIS
jgi:hypothetical protein